ncbi:MAG: hypothetical protein EG825_12220 [Rhodocyclaceae bacterium]|nr:hypothetical protein [Rhodocyclaceae bacterium]
MNAPYRFHLADHKPIDGPRDMQFSLIANPEHQTAVHVRHVGKKGKSALRDIDPWLMAYVADQKRIHPTMRMTHIGVELTFEPNPLDLEALRRRLSYLALNNGWSAHLAVGGSECPLYGSWRSLLSRPANEVVRPEFGRRNDNEVSNGDGDSEVRKTSATIEKYLQTWLAGKDTGGTNERLSIFGSDFYPKAGAAPQVIREYPTGVFDGRVSAKTRLLQKHWVDLVTINRRGDLAIIELKVNDPKLDVLAQGLDYGLYFSCYLDRLADSLTAKLHVQIKPKHTIACYIANNYFHPLFQQTAAYYAAPKACPARFSFNQIQLGQTIPFSRTIAPDASRQRR